MPETVTPLLTTGSAVVGADGKATVSIGPAKFGEKWTVRNAAIQSTSAMSSTCTVYRNVPSATTQVESSTFGNEDNSDTVQELTTGEHLLYLWEGATPGATCVVTLTGDARWAR